MDAGLFYNHLHYLAKTTLVKVVVSLLYLENCENSDIKDGIYKLVRFGQR